MTDRAMTAEDLLGARPDEGAAQGDQRLSAENLVGPRPIVTPKMEGVLKGTATGQILDYFGLLPAYERTGVATEQGFREGYGDKPLESTTQVAEGLKHIGLLPDGSHPKGTEGVIRALNWGVLAPTA